MKGLVLIFKGTVDGYVHLSARSTLLFIDGNPSDNPVAPFSNHLASEAFVSPPRVLREMAPSASMSVLLVLRVSS
jgi:hypothetical protein